jgi:hypothetical protein
MVPAGLLLLFFAAEPLEPIRPILQVPRSAGGNSPNIFVSAAVGRRRRATSKIRFSYPEQILTRLQRYLTGSLAG